MTANSTDFSQGRSESFWRELAERLLALKPSARDPGFPEPFALEAALHLSGGHSGWLETEAEFGPQIRARTGLTDEEVQTIRSRITGPLRQAFVAEPSAPAGMLVHIPFLWSNAKSLLILPLIVQGDREARHVGTLILLLAEKAPPSAQRQQTLLNLAATAALQIDLSQRTITEFSALSKQLRSYETLTQRSLAGIFRSTESGQILQCNAACARMMGYTSPDHMKQESCYRFYRHSEERDTLWRSLKASGGSAMIEAVRIRKDGRPIRLLQDLQLFPDEPNGAPVLHGTIFELRIDAASASRVSEEQNLYRRMVEKYCDAIILVDREARILFCGPSIEGIFGYRPEELVHHSGFEYVHPEDQTLVRSQLRKLIAGAAVLRAEIRLLHHNGLWRWVEMTASNQLDDPVLQGILLTYHDITERRQQDATVYREERRHKLIFEASGDVIWDWDIKTNSVRISGDYQTLFGYRPNQIEPNASWWFIRIHPDDVERMSHFFSQALTSDQEFWCDEFRIHLADGSWGFAFARGFILRDRDRSPLRMTGALTDMTAHHHLHRLLEEGYGNIAIGFLAINPDGILVYANPAAGHLLGTGDRRLSGLNIFHDEHLRRFAFVSRIKQALHNRAPQHTLEDVPLLQERLRIDIYPSQDGIIVYLQSAPTIPQGKQHHPLQIVAHLPAMMSTLIKPFTHRRP